MKRKQILVSAGDSITAKLVKEAGFDGIWVSGFEVSARLGLCDNGSLTMTEMLNQVKPIVEAVDIPVFVDVDTGYGYLSRTIKEFERIGVKGICVEDNITQKSNSLWGGKAPLMPIKDFINKIKIALKDRKSKNFKIIARTEALIRGYGMREALKRGKEYAKAGADIVLIHSRHNDGTEAQRIAKRWTLRKPLAIVPTKFPNTTNTELAEMGFTYIIWANQTERVKIKAIRKALQNLKEFDCAGDIEEHLSATLDDMRNLCPLS